MGVSKNTGTTKSSILIGFSMINHPFWGYPYFWKHPYQIDEYIVGKRNSTVSHKKLQSEVSHGNKDEKNATHTFFWTSLVLFSIAPFSSHDKTKITTTSTTKHQVVFVAGGRWSIRVVTPRSGSSTRPTWRQIGAWELFTDGARRIPWSFFCWMILCVFVYPVMRWAYRYSGWNI